MEYIPKTVMSNSSITRLEYSVKSLSPVTQSDLVSDEVRIIFQWIFYSVVVDLIAVFGVVANIINIICFLKQGFQDVANISLFGLAISDLGSLIPLIWANICFNPAFNELDLPFEPMEIQYLTGTGPHFIFTRVTGCMTALITFERCLCVTMPLKIKTIFTSKLVTALVIFFFTFTLCFTLPLYCVTLFTKRFSPVRNKTVVGLYYTENRDIAEAIVGAVTSGFIQMGAFTVVVVCTILLVAKLNSTTKWRQRSTTQGQAEMSKRDQKVTKMVVTISTLFIICFIPVSIIVIAMVFEPELSIQGRYRNLFFSIFSMCYVLETTNSAGNIFIYYQMSSKYKSTFRKLFKLST